MGKTNIKSTSFIRNLANLIDSDLVIVFDSLKANDISRLGTTIQIATTGLCPGSAYIDSKVVIDKSTIKRPVINIGIPTIINLKSIEKDMPSLIVSTNNRKIIFYLIIFVIPFILTFIFITTDKSSFASGLISNITRKGKILNFSNLVSPKEIIYKMLNKNVEKTSLTAQVNM